MNYIESEKQENFVEWEEFWDESWIFSMKVHAQNDGVRKKLIFAWQMKNYFNLRKSLKN
jgi:hypothetical protein